ncbi:MAG: stage II sporulation protein D [Oscillospiraceae bacterium]|nr:stage II sporulation protein D [Oscillospiraceae bacterium]
MKKYLLPAIIYCLLLTLLPALPSLAVQKTPSEPADMQVQSSEMPVFVEFTMPPTEQETVAKPSSPTVYYPVLDTQSGEVMQISERDYVIGAVCAEMPASFEPEALKAQAVAAHTYAHRIALYAESHPVKSLNGAYFSDDPNKYQAFYTNEEIRERFGSDYDLYYNKVADAVDAVLSEILTYEGEPIVAAFHAMSSGRTESAEHVWGTQTAYLMPVDSTGDKDAPRYEQDAVFTQDETKKRLTGARKGLTLPEDPQEWFSDLKLSESGTVLKLRVGDAAFTGQEIRSLFSLRSAAFSVKFADGAFTFTTRGYGHNVGMSQYGANAMAKEGKNYREILAYYYTGAEITEVA